MINEQKRIAKKELERLEKRREILPESNFSEGIISNIVIVGMFIVVLFGILNIFFKLL